MGVKEVVDVLTFVTVLITAGLAIRRFGLHREAATFLRVAVSARRVAVRGDQTLMSVLINLKNLGQTRIDARRVPQAESPYLYEDRYEHFSHAGTLQVRPIPDAKEPTHLDWYVLPRLPITAFLSPEAAGQVLRQPGDLEQVNYLDDYQDQRDNFRSTDFWLEPSESYELTVMMWLPPGIYAAKAVFLGTVCKPREDEYWSHVAVFEVGASAVDSAVPGEGLTRDDIAHRQDDRADDGA